MIPECEAHGGKKELPLQKCASAFPQFQVVTSHSWLRMFPCLEITSLKIPMGWVHLHTHLRNS